jgi:hypothetical protein
LVVLVDHVVGDFVPLFDQELPGPKDEGHAIVRPGEFSLSGALRIELLSDGTREWRSFTEGHRNTCMTFHVRVHSECHIDPPFDDSGAVGF